MPTTEMHEDLLDQLERGHLFRFADFSDLTGVIPGSGAGVYTIWDDEGGLVYAGIAGRNPLGKGLASRLRSHASGRRSGDQFCVYVADHYVLPNLSREQIESIRDSRLSMDALVRDKIHAEFGFRFVTVADYATALQVESAVKSGGLGVGPPRLNPSRRRGTDAGRQGPVLHRSRVVTLVLTLMSMHFVGQVSDRLVTLARTRDKYDPLANKAVLYLATNAFVMGSYTGPAYVGEIPTDEWIAESLTGASLHRPDGRGSLRAGPHGLDADGDGIGCE